MLRSGLQLGKKGSLTHRIETYRFMPLIKLKLQYFGHLMRRIDSLGKTLILGKVEARRRRE